MTLKMTMSQTEIFLFFFASSVVFISVSLLS